MVSVDPVCKLIRHGQQEVTFSTAQVAGRSLQRRAGSMLKLSIETFQVVSELFGREAMSKGLNSLNQ